MQELPDLKLTEIDRVAQSTVGHFRIFFCRFLISNILVEIDYESYRKFSFNQEKRQSEQNDEINRQALIPSSDCNRTGALVAQRFRFTDEGLQWHLSSSYEALGAAECLSVGW